LQVILQLVQPYTRVNIPFLASKLNVSAADVEALLVALILDGRIKGHIDQVRAVCRAEGVGLGGGGSRGASRGTLTRCVWCAGRKDAGVGSHLGRGGES
jgi:hypothetical protein